MPPEKPLLDITQDDLLAVARLMAGFPAPWWVAGGWAIDAFLGVVTRKHDDLEIGVARADQGHLHRFLGAWRLFKIVAEGNEARLAPWTEGEWLALPVHQIVARQEHGRPPEFEFFLNEIWDGEWRFRPDQSIRRPLAECHLPSPWGMPVFAPELQLLHKSRGHRPRDEHDFHAVLPHLDRSRRAWLRETLRRFRPDDPWLAELEESE